VVSVVSFAPQNCSKIACGQMPTFFGPNYYILKFFFILIIVKKWPNGQRIFRRVKIAQKPLKKAVFTRF
jgi:hypothetical protein